MEKPPAGKFAPFDHEGYSESPGEVVSRYLKDLHLKKESLHNRSILDIGAGSGNFVKGLKELGITEAAISLDRHVPEEDPESAYAVAKAQQLPFKDNSFDYVVSISALPQVSADRSIKLGTPTGEVEDGVPVYKVTAQNRKDYSQLSKASRIEAIKECLRVTKPNGEIRFGSIPKIHWSDSIEEITKVIENTAEIIEQSENDGLCAIKKNS